jgi:outer membrane protein OmpA-like peptidoglycan-associated protein
MASMIAELRKLVSPELLSDVTRQTHESDFAMTKACDAAIPAFAATIANRADDRGFMNQFVNLATGATADTGTAAGGWLSTLFGQNLAGATNSLARYAGIRESSASSLLMTCAPLIIGYFGRLIRSHNLSSTDLAERLRAERPHIESAMPAGFEMPWIHKPYETTRELVDETTRHPASRHEGWTVPIGALVAALLLGGLVWWGIESSRTREIPRVAVKTTAPSAVGTTGTFSRPPSPALPEPSRFAFRSGTAEDRLSRYLASTASGSMKVDLDRIGFGIGSSTLRPPSRAQIDNVAAILREYPKATVNVAGHTDNMGNEKANLALSRARAETVARALTNAGVNADRVHAAGYGSQNPIADNSTARGRGQNRRVTLEVSR